MMTRGTMRIKRLLLSALGVVLAIVLYTQVMILSGNFHAVVPGEIYRSAQPSAGEIARYADAHGIKSVLNLRGEHKGDAWYDAEVAASNAHHITHYDLSTAAKREFTDEQVTQLLDIMRRAPKPLLIHCHSGSDRTGLAAALYLSEIAQKPKEEAARQLSLRYGHLSLPITKTYNMDRTFERVTGAAR